MLRWRYSSHIPWFMIHTLGLLTDKVPINVSGTRFQYHNSGIREQMPCYTKIIGERFIKDFSKKFLKKFLAKKLCESIVDAHDHKKRMCVMWFKKGYF